jgi:hypothetical protein
MGINVSSAVGYRQGLTSCSPVPFELLAEKSLC